MALVRSWLFLVALLGGFFLANKPAQAIPLFSHEYGVSCQKCHSVVPHLNNFGLHFLANGYRMRGVSPGPAFPIATKINLVASSENQGSGPDGSGLPKAVVDEVEFFVAGLVGSRANYFVEQYVIDGGQHGALRDAWINERLTPWEARTPVNLQAGQFTLPLPVDPEAFRETNRHYAVFDQTSGSNPFNFFDPKLGAALTVGSPLHGTDLVLFAGPGHDRYSGLPTTGTDVMLYSQHVLGPITASAYHYQGTRPSDVLTDRFERQGYAVTFASGRWSSQTLLQTGYDSNAFGSAGIGASSSGGFTQLRYDISPRLFTIGRYEGTNDSSGFARDGVVFLGYRPSHNSVFSIEDDVAHVPQTKNTLVFQYTVGY